MNPFDDIQKYGMESFDLDQSAQASQKVNLLTMIISDERGNLSTQVAPGLRCSTRLISFSASTSVAVDQSGSRDGGVKSGRGGGGGARGCRSVLILDIRGERAEEAVLAQRGR